MTTYTQQQAVSLFCDYALYIHRDVILGSDVEDILTKKAVADARIAAMKSGKPKDYFVDWETPDGKVIPLLTLQGFLEAVSHYNADECLQKMREQDEAAKRPVLVRGMKRGQA